MATGFPGLYVPCGATTARLFSLLLPVLSRRRACVFGQNCGIGAEVLVRINRRPLEWNPTISTFGMSQNTAPTQLPASRELLGALPGKFVRNVQDGSKTPVGLTGVAPQPGSAGFLVGLHRQCTMHHQREKLGGKRTLRQRAVTPSASRGFSHEITSHKGGAFFP